MDYSVALSLPIARTAPTDHAGRTGADRGKSCRCSAPSATGGPEIGPAQIAADMGSATGAIRFRSGLVVLPVLASEIHGGAGWIQFHPDGHAGVAALFVRRPRLHCWRPCFGLSGEAALERAA